MKILALICFLGIFLSVYGDSHFLFMAKYAKYYSDCDSEPATALNRDDFKNAMSGKPFNAEQAAYFFCLNTKFGVQNEQGDYVREPLKKFFKHIVVNQDNIEKIVEICSTRPGGSSAKDAALSLFNCAKKIDNLHFPFQHFTIEA
uniref:Odorant-binding protein 26 n=1 Tax=Pyrrhalta aenescens TaxID=281545 RepID=A0A1J0KKM9_9CUCU|nr:odorant-binding protein 26 [Pyrrhalta aenescens]